MPRIKPFRGIRPDSKFATKVVLEIETLSLESAKVIREENPYSYVNMLVPKLENRYLRGSKRELAYKKINENFEEFKVKRRMKERNTDFTKSGRFRAALKQAIIAEVLVK